MAYRIRRRLSFLVVLCILTLCTYSNQAKAVLFEGIDFPDGASSFADALIRADPLHSGGPAATAPGSINPLDSLGVPDYDSGLETGSYALGNGGLVEVAFTDNLLTSSGNSDDDLYIFEIGPLVEDTFVAIRPTVSTQALLNAMDDADGDGFYEVGKVAGSISGIDIDSFFPGFAAGQLKFDAVQLIDDPNENQTTGVFVGADIDAVGAISSVPVPEPTSCLLLSLGLAAYVARRTRS